MSLLIFHPYLSIVQEKKPEIATRNLVEVAHWESAFTFSSPTLVFYCLMSICCLLSPAKQSEAKAGLQRKVISCIHHLQKGIDRLVIVNLFA